MNPIGEQNIVLFHYIMEGKMKMTKQKREKERAWSVRKQDQKPHGKVKSFKELANEER